MEQQQEVGARPISTTGNPKDAAVFCRGITKSYGSGETQVKALRGVDLEVRQGELLMLVGPSGCGKTTLISVVAGILDQDDGECLLFGQDLSRLPKHERVRYRGGAYRLRLSGLQSHPLAHGCGKCGNPAPDQRHTHGRGGSKSRSFTGQRRP
ncbi:MAG: ATP-binding cassette domain-containing protein [Desulfobulbus sp.]|nr:ATP-binding cassette domain-containing protein [Desulfobulbus sp.]